MPFETAATKRARALVVTKSKASHCGIPCILAAARIPAKLEQTVKSSRCINAPWTIDHSLICRAVIRKKIKVLIIIIII
jgi:hypothetical protein